MKLCTVEDVPAQFAKAVKELLVVITGFLSVTAYSAEYPIKCSLNLMSNTLKLVHISYKMMMYDRDINVY